MAANAASSAAAPPQTFPYDYLFKVLIIGDASVGKVRTSCNHDDILLLRHYHDRDRTVFHRHCWVLQPCIFCFLRGVLRESVF